MTVELATLALTVPEVWGMEAPAWVVAAEPVAVAPVTAGLRVAAETSAVLVVALLAAICALLVAAELAAVFEAPAACWALSAAEFCAMALALVAAAGGVTGREAMLAACVA
ncbi:MAG TPA: hypothetical protein VG710_05260 [Opitutus sp.]|nr:hypothetical protein [Opitutus sp.]